MIHQRNWGDISRRLEEEASGNGSSGSDKRMYRPKFAKDGTFEAVIRFLPAPGEEVPMIKKFQHRFKDKGGEFNAECLTTIGGHCPVCESNTDQWDGASEELKKTTLRPRSRQTSGISNILVISDPQVPSNNGKVFIYRYGKIILEKVTEKCFPDKKKIETGVVPVNVFDYYTGATFRISAVKKIIGDGKSIPKYDSSAFDAPAPVGDEALIESLEKQLFSLKEFSEPSKFMPYDKQKELFDKVRGFSGGAPAPAAAPAPVQQQYQAPVQQQPVRESAPVQQPAQPQYQAAAPAPVQQAPAPAPVANAAPTNPATAFNAMEEQSEDDFWSNIKK